MSETLMPLWGPNPIGTMAVIAPPLLTDDPATETDSARRAGGPQDRALYECDCGATFVAPVSTSVGCPHCGCGQAW
jgi:hypothetical protein